MLLATARFTSFFPTGPNGPDISGGVGGPSGPGVIRRPE